jgi:hypothetical protein
MAAPVANVADLAVKAQVIKDHVDDNYEFITAIQVYVDPLLADVATLAT